MKSQLTKVTNAMVEAALRARDKFVRAHFPTVARWPADYSIKAIDEEKLEMRKILERAVLFRKDTT